MDIYRRRCMPREGESWVIAPGSAQNTLRKRAEESSEKMERSLQQKNQSQWSWWNGGQGTPRMRHVRATEILKETEAQQTRLNLKWSIRDNGWEASEIRNQRFRTMHLLKIKGPRKMLREQGDGPHPDKKPCSPVKTTNKPRRLSIGSYQAAITPRKRLLT